MRTRPNGRRPCPADFTEAAAMMTRKALKRHFRAGDGAIQRWSEETGAVPLEGTRAGALPVPADLADRAAEMHIAELARHYRVSHQTVARWLGRAGIRAKEFDKKAAALISPPPRRAVPPSQMRAFAGPKSSFVGLLPRDTSVEGRAADHLRRETRATMYRCTETGAADQGGKFWRFGAVALTRDEMLERARRHGFEPDGWARIPPSPRQGMPQQQGAM